MSDGVKTIRYAGELKEYLMDDVNMICVLDNEKIVKRYKEVIFCEDCIYGDKGWCDIWQHSMKPDDFCSKGIDHE